MIHVSKIQTSLTEYPEVPSPEVIWQQAKEAKYVEIDTETDKAGR